VNILNNETDNHQSYLEAKVFITNKLVDHQSATFYFNEKYNHETFRVKIYSLANIIKGSLLAVAS